jgi:excinuclease ABC subunit A
MSAISSSFLDSRWLTVKGAREHNLKNITLTLPKNALVVFTGVSGSGKSSLAFDTIYAEGQRRYIESLSAYARQFLNSGHKPDVDEITGLAPAISIEQKTTSKSPRSTVGTVTEIYDYMRVLWARIGTPFSPATGLPIESQTIGQMVEHVYHLFTLSSRLVILAPLIRGRKGEYRKEFDALLKQGYQRAKVDGSFYDIADIPPLKKNQNHDIDIVIDRLVLNQDSVERLTDSFETACALAHGLVALELYNASSPTENEHRKRILLSSKAQCPISGFSLPELEPRLFSFNSPHGACPKCEGLGSQIYHGALTQIPDHIRGAQRAALITDRSEKIYDRVHDEDEEMDLETLKCAACQGKRLKPEALTVRIGNKNIAEISDLSITELIIWFLEIPHHLSEKQKTIAQPLLREIINRLNFLSEVGLGYLTLSRASGSLSGGESQRIRLASQIGSGLTGVLYVLDEPSIGLHQRDNERLIKTLKHLRDLGNTVIVVEHDEDTIRTADHIVDIGIGAGRQGGEIVAQGKVEDIIQVKESLTGQYLAGIETVPLPQKRRTSTERHMIISGAKEHNLKNVTASFPIEALTVVTGLSGSGKSSLVMDVLARYAKRYLEAKDTHAHFNAPSGLQLHGLDAFDRLIRITQTPIGRTSRSNPATYIGAFTAIREWFAGLPLAKERGYTSGRFSFNVPGGRCEACKGEGFLSVSMHFLPDVSVVCDVCHGQRYTRELCDVRYQGYSIADILTLTIDEVCSIFHAIPSIRSKLNILSQVGLGYIPIGQSATTLSGGEAQRTKLAKELCKRSTGRTLYILDEPTTGLHPHDVSMLIKILQTLVDQKNTVIIIEHNLDVIKVADWIIDLGPEGGNAGGYVIAQGTPEDITSCPGSYTGQFLKKLLHI